MSTRRTFRPNACGTSSFIQAGLEEEPEGAIVLMAIINGATAAVVATNLRNARGD